MSSQPYTLVYKQTDNPLLLADASWERYGEDKSDVQNHFDAIHAMLLDRLDQLKDRTTPLTVKEEKELRFILESLLQVTQTLHD